MCVGNIGFYPDFCLFGKTTITVRKEEPLFRIDYPQCIRKLDAEYIDDSTHKGWYEKR